MKRNMKGSRNTLSRAYTAYAWISVGLVFFAHVYRLFGHGMTSASMENAHLYTLGLGFAFMWILNFVQVRLKIRLASQKAFPWFFDIFNTGVAFLAARGIIKGILDIAGYASPKVSIFVWCAVACFAAALVMLVLCFVMAFIQKKHAA